MNVCGGCHADSTFIFRDLTGWTRGIQKCSSVVQNPQKIPRRGHGILSLAVIDPAGPSRLGVLHVGTYEADARPVLYVITVAFVDAYARFRSA